MGRNKSRDKYVLEEFRKHKNAKESFLTQFYMEWHHYLSCVNEQTSVIGIDAIDFGIYDRRRIKADSN